MYNKVLLLLAARLICEVQEWRARWETEITMWGKKEMCSTAQYPYETPMEEIIVGLLKCEAANIGLTVNHEDENEIKGVVLVAMGMRECPEPGLDGGQVY